MNHRLTILHFILWLTLMPTAVYAQLSIKREVDRPSTSVSEFVRYNNSPQLYSGKLSLSIPIYTLSDEDFTIPISLDYNYNGFIPNIPPSEFGVGWNLSCGGYITREVKGIPDETISSINLQNNLNSTLWGFDFLPDTDKSGYQNLLIQYYPLSEDTSPKNSLLFFLNNGSSYYDAEPDIYHFSFLGRSGSFTISSESGKFQAFNTSSFDGDYKIEKILFSPDNGSFLYPSAFIISTSEGYRYYFGDDSKNSIGLYTERQMLLREESPSEEEIRSFCYPAIAWALRKIVAPNGREVYFYYNDNKGEVPTVVTEKGGILDFSENIYSLHPSAWIGGMNSNNFFSSGSSLNPHPQRNSKCRLTSIHTDTFEIYFDYADKTTEQVSYYIKSGSLSRLSNGYAPLLSEITLSNGQRVASLKYLFNTEGSPYPFLQSIYISGEGSFTFDYKNIETNYLPPLGSTAIDHWGYLKSTTPSVCNSAYFTSSMFGTISSNYDETLPPTRDANFATNSVGLITSLHYPTGGYSKFFWEPNRYRSALRRISSNNFVPTIENYSSDLIAPGGRICKIVNYDKDGTAIDSTSYKYITESNIESGLLLRYPRYGISYNGLLDNNNFSYSYMTSGDLLPFDGMIVEYPRVEEIKNDSSLIIHHFSSWQTNPDSFATNRHPMPRILGSNLGNYVNPSSAILNDATAIANILRPTSSKQFLRGKLLSQTVLDSLRDTIKQTTNSYMSNGAYYPEYAYVGEAYSEIELFAGGCYPLSNTTKDYLDDGTTIILSTTYSYNDIGQIIQEMNILSNGESLLTIYRYPQEMVNEPIGSTIYHQMIADNFIGYPIEVEKRLQKVGENSTTLLHKERYTFQKFIISSQSEVGTMNAYKPILIENLDLSSGQYYTLSSFEYDENNYLYLKKKIDGNGNITLYQWSPLGVINITENSQEEVQHRQQWQYTYFKHNLPSSITDPSGRTIYYTYDEQDRLTSITNSKGEKIEEYYYNTITR